MACAKTVICTDVSDNYLFIRKKELLCNPLDYTSITLSLKYLLKLSPMELQKIGEENRILANKLFSKNIIINEYLEIIEK